MPKPLLYALIVVPLILLFISHTAAEEPSSPHYLLYPNHTRILVRDNVLTLVARVNEETVSAVRVFVPWDSTFRFDIATKGERAQRVRDIERTLPGDLLAQRFLLRSFPYHQAADSENVTFEFSEKRNGRTFLLQDTTRGITKALLSREGTMSILQITGWLPTVVQTRSERTRFCRGNTVALPVTVQPGHNTIRYEILSSENQVTYRDTISVYYSIELSARPAPPEFRKTAFHTSANEAECIRCHSASAGSKKGEPQLRCNSCHAALTRQRSVHGLLAANDCTQCHETKPGSGYRTTYAPHQENMKCFGCHEDVRKELKGKQFVHAPLAGGQCSICHSPHASPQVSQLRMRVNDLCLSCHSDKNDSNHPIVFHPSEAKSDPRNPEREFTCASCHNPHASDNKNMLATAGGYFTLCQSCHKK